MVGALSEFVKYDHNIDQLRRAGGIPYLVTLLNYTYKPLLENVPLVLKECAKDFDSMRIIEELDGVRLIWSLLKNDSPNVCLFISYNSKRYILFFFVSFRCKQMPLRLWYRAYDMR